MISSNDARLTSRQICSLLILLAASITLGRIAIVERFFGDNDGSRWLTAQALSTYGSYHIGERLEYANGEYVDRGLLFKDGEFRSIDVVLKPEPLWENPEAKGSVPIREKRFFSSKPTLLPTLLGQVAILLTKVGLNWEDHSWVMIRVGLLLFNWLPFVLMVVVLADLVEGMGGSDWSRILAVAAACFGTYLTSFQTSINNHTVAAAALTFSLYFWLRQERATLLNLTVSGLWAGFAAASELPALAYVGLAAVAILLRTGTFGSLVFSLAAVVPLAGQLGLNQIALGSWIPAYANFGTEWYEFPGSYWAKRTEIDAAQDPVWLYFIHLTIGHHGFFSLTPIFFFALPVCCFAWIRPNCLNAQVRAVARLFSALMAILLAFYVMRSNNYGGWTLGPRWLFWLIPMAILLLPTGLERWQRSAVGRGVALAALGVSAFSAFHLGLNPWYHPWLYRLGKLFGWWSY